MFPQNRQHLFSEYFLYEEEQTIPLHSHEFFEIGITISGSACHHAENHQTTLKKGSIYLIPVGVAHEISHTKHWQVHNLYLLPNSFSNELSIEKTDYMQLQYFLSKYSHQQNVLAFQLNETTFHSVAALFTAASTISLTSSELRNDYIRNCLINILILICEDFRQIYGKQSLSFNRHLPEITSLIQAHPELPLTELREFISKSLSLNPQHINRIMKKNLSISISQYILSCKIEHSIRLLSTNLSITEIAQALGFYDHSHFYKYFHRYTGVSPQEYQKHL